MGLPGRIYFAATLQCQVRSQEPHVSQDGERLEKRGWQRLKAENLSSQMTPGSGPEAFTILSSELILFGDAIITLGTKAMINRQNHWYFKVFQPREKDRSRSGLLKSGNKISSELKMVNA